MMLRTCGIVCIPAMAFLGLFGWIFVGSAAYLCRTFAVMSSLVLASRVDACAVSEAYLSAKMLICWNPLCCELGLLCRT
jgi:hypothetical protein